MTLDELLSRLDGVSGGDGQWTANCPAHDDRHSSLTVARGRDGRLLVTCWKGCALDDVARAAGVSVADLFESNGERALTNGKPTSLAALALPTDDELARYAKRLQDSPATLAMLFEHKGWRAPLLLMLGVGRVGDRVGIPVRDAAGVELVNFLRYSADGKLKPKMLAEQGHPRVPLYAFDDDDGPVFIVEGEADGISVVHLGLNVIAAPGATAKARPEWLDVVEGRDVYVCMDNDDPGRKAAQRWAREAHSKGASVVRVFELAGPVGFDVGELLVQHRDEPDEARRLFLEASFDAPDWAPGPRVVSTPELVEPIDDATIEALKPGELITRPMTSVRSRRIVWLWRERIPRGRVGIVFGPPGQGKSTLLALIIAEITRAGGRVLIASAEDDAETTIRPRLIAADAMLDRVTLLSTRAATGETNLLLPRDIDVLAAAMAEHALLMIDPLAAHLGDDVNTWNEQQVRALVLAPLAWHARRHDCAVAAIMHLNKSQGSDALSRISGSGGFGGAARFAMLLGSHPDDVGKLDARQALVHVKASEGPRLPALVFRRDLVDVVDSGAEMQTPALELVSDDTIVSAEAVLAVTDPDEAGAFTDAVEWLQHELVDGPKLAKRLIAGARERGDFSERTLRKAKRALRVKSVREQEGWLWSR